jgi:TPR repeat protein
MAEKLPEHEAVDLLRKAADQEHVESQLKLSKLLSSGIGIWERCPAEAFHWAFEAATQGNEEAQIIVGNALALGDGVDVNTEHANIWLHLAAESKSAPARFALYEFLYKTTPMDDESLNVEMAELLSAAAEERYAPAIEVLSTRANNRAIARMCCAGCGQKDRMQTCKGCRWARFCGKECSARMWPIHKPHCLRWRAEIGR